MTDRGLPIVDGAPACPFVAYEDDRDARGQEPDHRHRCYAEPRPAPRASAHQAAYCLSSAFPVCPTFQDWARREAATARAAEQVDDEPEPASYEEPVGAQPMPPLERPPKRAPGTDTPAPLAPRRNPPRDWAAPPPWTGGNGEDGAAEAPPFLAPAAPVAPAASLAIRAGRPCRGSRRGRGGRGGRRLRCRAGSRLRDRLPRARGQRRRSARRLVRHELDRRRRSVRAVTRRVCAAAQRVRPPRADPADRLRSARRRRRRVARAVVKASPSAAAPAAASPSGGRPSSAQAKPQRQDAEELFGPAWERPRKYEAYPSLRTRVGLPAIGGPPRIVVALAALVFAAVVLFFVGPMLLGLGGGGSTPGGPAASATVAPGDATPTPIPTTPPAPTPVIYVVGKGDTISKIARKNHVTVEQLLAANPKIKNPDRIKVGDQITIPIPEPDSGSAAP